MYPVRVAHDEYLIAPEHHAPNRRDVFERRKLIPEISPDAQRGFVLQLPPNGGLFRIWLPIRQEIFEAGDLEPAS
ncbi:MAG: hypothetical protein H0V83_16440 [Rubrobacter sp.]|nr:hypothetical protein [Rubrobacter sp.]